MDRCMCLKWSVYIGVFNRVGFADLIDPICYIYFKKKSCGGCITLLLHDKKKILELTNNMLQILRRIWSFFFTKYLFILP
jgi:hypothetical protein